MAAIQISKQFVETDCPSPLRGVLPLRGFSLACGLKLDNGGLAWQSWGAQHAPVVIVLGGISAGRDLAG